MKIAFVLTQSLDSPSGLGRYGPIARELVKLGYQVEVIALHPAWDLLDQKQFIDEGVLVKYVGQMHVRKVGDQKIYFNQKKLLWISLLAIIRLTLAVFRSDATILHLGKPQPFNIIAARLGRRKRPLYIDCDDYEAETNKFSNPRQKQVVRYFEDSIIHYATALTTNTTFSRQRYIKLGYPQNRIYFIPNGVERKRFEIKINKHTIRQHHHIPEDAPLIGYIGTIGLHSHPVNLLLEAFATIHKQQPSAYLILVGGGEDFDTLKKQAHELNIQERTIFTGRISPHDIPHYYAAFNLSIDPIYDNLIAHARAPLKIVESLVMGIPTITSNVGDREMYLKNGQLGLFVKPGSAAGLAQGIMTLIKNNTLRQQMSKLSIDQKERWFWDQLIATFAMAYKANK